MVTQNEFFNSQYSSTYNRMKSTVFEFFLIFKQVVIVENLSEVARNKTKLMNHDGIVV